MASPTFDNAIEENQCVTSAKAACGPIVGGPHVNNEFRWDHDYTYMSVVNCNNNMKNQ